MKAKRRQSIGFVEAQVAVAVSIGKRDDTLAAEGAVSIHQVGEPLILDVRLDGILHGLLARQHRHGQEKQCDEIVFLHCFGFRR